MTTLNLKTFLDEYGESMAEKVTDELTVIHDPANEKEDVISELLKDLKKRPFPSQVEIIKASYKSLISGNKAVYTVCEMGTGKTLLSIATAYALHKFKGLKRVLVVCPPHLVLKWVQEIKEALPFAKAYNLNKKDIISQLEIIRRQPEPVNLELYIIGRERVKTGFLWRPAIVTKNKKHYCPKCGQELIDKDGYPLPVFGRNNQGRYKKKYSCTNTVLKWKYNHEKEEHIQVEDICGEQLWQPDIDRSNHRKAMPAKFIKKNMKGFYELFIADEVHQFKNESGQGYAFGALSSAPKYVLCLTGTLAGGYSTDVYHLLFRTHPKLMIDDNHRFGNPSKFIERYGVLERITTISEQDGLTTKSKKRTIVKQKPGISPLLLGKMLLSNSVFMRLSDCMEHLQPYEEDVIELSMIPQMAGLYSEFEEILRAALIEALVKGDHSLLGGYLHALLSYPERIYKGVQVIHPHTKDIVAYGKPLQGVMPKEKELIAIIKSELQEKRKVLVYAENTNTTDITHRLVDMIEEEDIKVKVLKSGDTENRAKIIEKYVKQGIEVLITNPRKVEVGMDLLDFPSIVFYQIPMSTYTLRQASRRSWRIPQTRPVKVFFLTYGATMQTRLMKLMAEKLISSLALEGELTDKGLAALSESSDSMAIELAKMLVEKSEDNRNLKDIWADYRKKEVQVEIRIDETESLPTDKTEEEDIEKKLDVKKASIEKEKIGDKVVKVSFIEYTGKRKKKVTHIEVKQEELDEMLSEKDNAVNVQFSMF